MKNIPLTQGKYAIVDDEDYLYLSQFNWCYSQGRAGRMGRNKSGKRKLLLMHRVIMNTPTGLETDHINGDSLDNRRCNLRICTKSQNNMNRRPNKGKMSSQYKGVCWRNHAKKWKAYIKLKGKQIHLGYYASEHKAARVYNEAANVLFGEFARLNTL